MIHLFHLDHLLIFQLQSSFFKKIIFKSLILQYRLRLTRKNNINDLNLTVGRVTVNCNMCCINVLAKAIRSISLEFIILLIYSIFILMLIASKATVRIWNIKVRVNSQIQK